MTRPVICPTVMGRTKQEFIQKIKHFSTFADRIHVDLSDGIFASPKLLTISELFWPPEIIVDFHIMYQKPKEHLEEIIVKEPHLAIFHIEAEDWQSCAATVRSHGIKAGVALLADTPVEKLIPHLDQIDHILIFSGSLGSFGGIVDFELLQKIRAIMKHKNDIEIGWDGGINNTNVRRLAEGGVAVLNTGGFINNATRPEEAYAILEKEVGNL